MEERVLHAEGGKLLSTLLLSAKIRMKRICAGGSDWVSAREVTKARVNIYPVNNPQ